MGIKQSNVWPLIKDQFELKNFDRNKLIDALDIYNDQVIALNIITQLKAVDSSIELHKKNFIISIYTATVATLTFLSTLYILFN